MPKVYTGPRRRRSCRLEIHDDLRIPCLLCASAPLWLALPAFRCAQPFLHSRGSGLRPTTKSSYWRNAGATTDSRQDAIFMGGNHNSRSEPTRRQLTDHRAPRPAARGSSASRSAALLQGCDASRYFEVT